MIHEKPVVAVTDISPYLSEDTCNPFMQLSSGLLELLHGRLPYTPDSASPCVVAILAWSVWLVPGVSTTGFLASFCAKRLLEGCSGISSGSIVWSSKGVATLVMAARDRASGIDAT